MILAAQMINVRSASEADLETWQEFVDRSTGAGAMHHAAWYSILRDAYRVKPYFLIAEHAPREIVGLLPLYHSRSLLTGSHLSSLEDGVLAADEKTAEILLAKGRSLRDEIGAKFLQIRGGPVSTPGARNFTSVRTLIDIAPPTEALWSAIKKKTRWAIRQAEKTTVRIVRDEALSGLKAFHRIYAEHMRSLGTPVMGIDAFFAMERHLGPSRLRLYSVREGHRLIGGMLCIINKQRWTDYLAVVRPSNETDFANYLLYWYVIRDAAECGASVLDLGRSLPNSNVHLFKRKWGGRDKEICYHFYPATGFGSIKAGLEVLKRNGRLPQRIWSHLPLAVCNSLGPLLRKQLPFI